jgi:hypothetical protein
MNLAALKAVELSLYCLSAASMFTSSQVWLYRKGYKDGHDIGKHTGFTEGLFRGQQQMQKRIEKLTKRPLSKTPTIV